MRSKNVLIYNIC